MGKKNANNDRFYFIGLQNHWAVTSTMKLKGLLLGKKAMTNLDSVVRSRDITLPTKVCITKAVIFPVIMYRYESWTIKKDECWRLMLSNCGAGEDSWESLEQQGDETSQSQRNQPRIFIRRTDAKAEAPIFWLLDVKNWLIWKDPDAGKDWEQEEKGTTKDEMVV